MADNWTVFTAAILSLCTAVAATRFCAFGEQLQWVSANDTATPGSPNSQVSDYWTMQDNRNLWMVYGWWLALPAVGFFIGIAPPWDSSV